jgi:hypothetical protein
MAATNINSQDEQGGGAQPSGCLASTVTWRASPISRRPTLLGSHHMDRAPHLGRRSTGGSVIAVAAASPTLSKELTNAIIDALAAHTTMSKQALDSERVREGLKDVLLGPAQLYEALRERAGQ